MAILLIFHEIKWDPLPQFHGNNYDIGYTKLKAKFVANEQKYAVAFAANMGGNLFLEARDLSVPELIAVVATAQVPKLLKGVCQLLDILCVSQTPWAK